MSQRSHLDLEARIAALEAERAAKPRRHLGRKRLAVLLVAIALAAPAVVLASHQFTDVPTGNSFHSQISTLATAGITRGCNPPSNTRYCPADPVHRDQMAAFIIRSAGRMDQTLFELPIVVDQSAFASLTIKTEGRAWIDADAAFYFLSENTPSGVILPCENNAHLEIDGTIEARTFAWARTRTNPASGDWDIFNAATHLSIAVDAGTHTVNLIWDDGQGTCEMGIGRGSLSAQVIPFDASTGGTPALPVGGPAGGGASGSSSSGR
jgi:hypothetical protein